MPENQNKNKGEKRIRRGANKKKKCENVKNQRPKPYNEWNYSSPPAIIFS